MPPRRSQGLPVISSSAVPAVPAGTVTTAAHAVRARKPVVGYCILANFIGLNQIKVIGLRRAPQHSSPPCCHWLTARENEGNPGLLHFFRAGTAVVFHVSLSDPSKKSGGFGGFLSKSPRAPASKKRRPPDRHHPLGDLRRKSLCFNFLRISHALFHLMIFSIRTPDRSNASVSLRTGKGLLVALGIVAVHLPSPCGQLFTGVAVVAPAVPGTGYGHPNSGSIPPRKPG